MPRRIATSAAPFLSPRALRLSATCRKNFFASASVPCFAARSPDCSSAYSLIGLELEDLLEERQGLWIEALFREVIGDARVLLEAFVDLLGAYVEIAQRVGAVPVARLGLDDLDVLGDGGVDLAEFQGLFRRL